MNEKEKSRSGDVLASASGFVSLYFLMMFLLISMLAALFLLQTENRLRTAINLRKANEYLREEAAVLAYMKCALSCKEIAEGTVTENGVTFSLHESSAGWTVSILSPLEETLYVECDSDGKLYDYEANRSETPA